MPPSQERLLYEELATQLVTPERFGKVAVAAVQQPFPELARIYDFPAQPEQEA